MEGFTSKDLRELLDPTNEPGYLGCLDGYKIFNVVGSGGMGTVLRAFDPRLQRVVAIKVLRPLLGDETARRRFLREAQAAARVKDDNVVTIYSINEDFEPPYIVMEYVEGRTLQQKIADEARLQAREVIEIARQIAKGLVAAHGQGQVHRDIKPANVLLEERSGRVKIADFGLATIPGADQLTHSGQILGTPRYMSPEQARGDTVGPSSDIFSFGVILYELCTGVTPFQADSPIAILRRICEDSPKPVHESDENTPLWLSNLIDRLLSKDPRSRPSSAELVCLLETGKSHDFTSTQNLASTINLVPASGVSDESNPRQSQRVVVTAAIIILLMLAFWLYRANSKPHPDAVLWPVNDHWYLVVQDPEVQSWDQANAHASDMGGHLATVTDEDEERFLLGLINDDKFWTYNKLTDFYGGPFLGAIQLDNAREPDGGWRWITGEPFVYSDWHADSRPEHSQPNDDRSPTLGQNHIFFHSRERDFLKAGWGDASATSPTCFVVEFDDFVVEPNDWKSGSSYDVVDSYASIRIKYASSRDRGLSLSNGTKTVFTTTFDREYTFFVPPGVYTWRLKDLSGRQSEIESKISTITVNAGDQLYFDSNGPVIPEPAQL